MKTILLILLLVFTAGCPSTKLTHENGRPAVSAEFAKKHPVGSYVPGELLVGMHEGFDMPDSQKALWQAIPGLEVVKAMVNGTLFHVRLPVTMNVEQGMTKLKTVKGVLYAELNGTTYILLGKPTYEVYVKGLVCPSCAVGLKSGLMKLPFIKSIHVNYKTGLVLIYEIDNRIDNKGIKKYDKSRITKAIDDSGYDLDKFVK